MLCPRSPEQRAQEPPEGSGLGCRAPGLGEEFRASLWSEGLGQLKLGRLHVTRRFSARFSTATPTCLGKSLPLSKPCLN